jgi:hypothetical protein
MPQIPDAEAFQEQILQQIGDDLTQNAKSACRTHLAVWWYFAAACRRIVALQ